MRRRAWHPHTNCPSSMTVPENRAGNGPGPFFNTDYVSMMATISITSDIQSRSAHRACQAASRAPSRILCGWIVAKTDLLLLLLARGLESPSRSFCRSRSRGSCSAKARREVIGRHRTWRHNFSIPPDRLISRLAWNQCTSRELESYEYDAAPNFSFAR
jgi:hypothetical protein